MKRYRVYYSSMSAYYELGHVYAESKEEAERVARAESTAFSSGEKGLIHATESED